MKEEEFKSAIQNMLMMQNNNDRNFEILQRQIDNLQKQLTDLNDLRKCLGYLNQRTKTASILR